MSFTLPVQSTLQTGADRDTIHCLSPRGFSGASDLGGSNAQNASAGGEDKRFRCARIVLLTADGLQHLSIADHLG